MNDEIKNLIDELKEVVMELHRSAGNLDDCIQTMEQLLSEEDLNDKDCARFIIRSGNRSRAESDYNHQYYKLIDKENGIWQRLLIASNK